MRMCAASSPSPGPIISRSSAVVFGNPSIKSCKRRPGNLPFLSMGLSCDTEIAQTFVASGLSFARPTGTRNHSSGVNVGICGIGMLAKNGATESSKSSVEAPWVPPQISCAPPIRYQS